MSVMVDRDIELRLKMLAREFPAIVLTGPRQSGKSTLCQKVFARLPYATLESPDMRAFALEDPRGFLKQFPRGRFWMKFKTARRLSSYLQEIIDREPAPGRWILTGSHNLSVMESTSQSLAGRSAVLHLLPLSRHEVVEFPQHPKTLNETLLTGGYPRILDRKLRPADWLSSYVATYLERDVRSLSNIGDLVTFQRFTQLSAGRISQLLNLSSWRPTAAYRNRRPKPGRRCWRRASLLFGCPATTGMFPSGLSRCPSCIFTTPDWRAGCLGIRDTAQLDVHPLRGAIFESWVVSEIIKQRFNRGESNGVYFFRDKSGLESDVLVQGRKTLKLVEVKAGQTISSDWAANNRKITGMFDKTKQEVSERGGLWRNSKTGTQWCDLSAVARDSGLLLGGLISGLSLN